MRWKYIAAVPAALLIGLGMLATIRYFAPVSFLHTVAISGAPISVALDERTGNAFVTTDLPSNLVVLDARRGTVAHTIPLPDSAAGQPNVDEQSSWVAVNTNDGKSRIYDARTGRRLFTTPQLDPNGIATDTALGHVFSVTQGGVILLDLHSGRVLSRLQTQAQGLIALVQPTARVFVSSGGTGASNDPGTVLMLDAHTGALLRTIVVGTGAWDLKVDPGSNHVFVVAQGANTITMLDGKSGDILRTVHLGAALGLAPGAIVGSRVLALDWGAPDTQGRFTRPGHLDVLDAVSGRLLRSIPVGVRPNAVVLEQHHNRIFVANWGASGAGTNAPLGNGTVSVVDGVSFRVVSTSPVGYNPQRIYVDKQADRVYVFNIGTFSASANVWPSSLSVLDAGSGTVRRTISLGSGGIQVEHDARTGQVFIVTNAEGSAVPEPPDQVPGWLRQVAPWLPRPQANPCAQTGCVTMLDTNRL